MPNTIRVSTHDHAASRKMTYDADGARCAACGQAWVLVRGETAGKDRLIPQSYAGAHPAETVPEPRR